MTINSKIANASISGMMSVFGAEDHSMALLRAASKTFTNEKTLSKFSSVRRGVVEQFNVGLYSALVSVAREEPYVCMIGAYNVTAGLGYSDSTILREGDRVIFCIMDTRQRVGMILAKEPSIYSVDTTHKPEVSSASGSNRRTSFLSSSCYRHSSSAYSKPVSNPNDSSTRVYTNSRPADLVPGEACTLNQNHCGFIGGMYSTTIAGGGANIRMFSLENRIRVTADSILRFTLSGNDNDWHAGRYLSRENTTCLYQEERMGLASAGATPTKPANYDSEGYYTKNLKKRQTARPRIIDQKGYYGNLSSRYCVQPDDSIVPRTMNDTPKDVGVARESIDPSGQYRLATTGMLGIERIGHIPVPVRINYPWQLGMIDESDKPSDHKLEPFKHNEEHPYYRQLELADRVAYDLKNSYARIDENDRQFYIPEEHELQGKINDVYDHGFTGSETVKLKKFENRRSGIWQGEDGSIIFRDAWGSEIVMIGGNIQISCAGNVEILPGKSALTLAGDDIIHKAQNSIDVESADKDVRINAYRNVQVLAGVNADIPGGITLEARGKSGVWDMTSSEGGESVQTSGILLKAAEGSVVTDTANLVLKSKDNTSIVSGNDKDIESGEGKVFISAENVYGYGSNVIFKTELSSLLMSKKSASITADNIILAGVDGFSAFKGDRILVPLMWYSIDYDVAKKTQEQLESFTKILNDEETVSFGYSEENLEKMTFKFRSSSECGTETSWEIGGDSFLTLYEPFWSQVSVKFDTLSGIDIGTFNDHIVDWPSDTGNPWPGKSATTSAKYAKLSSDGPVNMLDHGLNRQRKDVKSSTEVVTTNLFDGYKIRK